MIVPHPDKMSLSEFTYFHALMAPGWEWPRTTQRYQEWLAALLRDIARRADADLQETQDAYEAAATYAREHKAYPPSILEDRP